MQRVTLKSEPRTERGKGASRNMRRGGFIPAIIYKRGKETESLKMNHKEVVHFINSHFGEQVLVNLQMPDNTTRLAFMKEYQVHPLRGELLHADFQELAIDEKIKMRVGVHTVGLPIGVKRDKGILQMLCREVEIECLPNDLVGSFEVDITNLAAGQNVHVSDLVPPSGVTILSDPKEVICLVTASSGDETPAGEAAKEEGKAS